MPGRYIKPYFGLFQFILMCGLFFFSLAYAMPSYSPCVCTGQYQSSIAMLFYYQERWLSPLWVLLVWVISVGLDMHFYKKSLRDSAQLNAPGLLLIMGFFALWPYQTVYFTLSAVALTWNIWRLRKILINGTPSIKDVYTRYCFPPFLFVLSIVFSYLGYSEFSLLFFVLMFFSILILIGFLSLRLIALVLRVLHRLQDLIHKKSP